MPLSQAWLLLSPVLSTGFLWHFVSELLPQAPDHPSTASLQMLPCTPFTSLLIFFFFSSLLIFYFFKRTRFSLILSLSLLGLYACRSWPLHMLSFLSLPSALREVLPPSGALLCAWVKAPGRQHRTCLLPFQVCPQKTMGAWGMPVLCTEPAYSRCLTNICCMHEEYSFSPLLYSILLYSMPHPNINPFLSLLIPITGK